jgi:hypothetical protein
LRCVEGHDRRGTEDQGATRRTGGSAWDYPGYMDLLIRWGLLLALTSICGDPFDGGYIWSKVEGTAGVRWIYASRLDMWIFLDGGYFWVRWIYACRLNLRIFLDGGYIWVRWIYACRLDMRIFLDGGYIWVRCIYACRLDMRIFLDGGYIWVRWKVHQG